MEKLSDYHLINQDAGVLLSFFSGLEGGDIGMVTQHASIPTKIKFWGAKNTLPENRDRLLMESNIVGTLISKKRDIFIGHGLMAYMEVFTDKGKEKIPMEIRPEILEWIEESGYLESYEDPAVLNWYKHANVFAEFVMTKGDKVFSITTQDCKYVRAAEKMNGKIPAYYVCADWSLAINKRDNPVVAVPAYMKDRKQSEFMMHIGDNTFDDGYYFHPAYWGGEEWIDLANRIPVFHKSNIKNGYTIRWHIKIPKDYFLDKVAYNAATTEKERKTCIDNSQTSKQKFIDDMNKFLSGEDNAGRAIYTMEDFDPILKDYKGIKIEPIEFDMKDESLLKLFEISDKANIAAQGLPATLAGIETQGRLSSGSEIRNFLAYYIITSLYRPRRVVLKPFELMLKLNGWYDQKVKYTFEDIIITKLDEDKSGQQSMNNNAEAQ